MNKKHIIIVFFIILSLFAVACDKTDKVIIDDEKTTAVSNKNEQAESIDEPNESENKKATDVENQPSNNQAQGKLELIQTINTDPNIPDYNEEKVAEGVSRGLESPNDELEIYKYVPLSSDTIQYTSQNSSLELSESLSHKGLKSLEITYEKIE